MSNNISHDTIKRIIKRVADSGVDGGLRLWDHANAKPNFTEVKAFIARALKKRGSRSSPPDTKTLQNLCGFADKVVSPKTGVINAFCEAFECIPADLFDRKQIDAADHARIVDAALQSESALEFLTRMDTANVDEAKSYEKTLNLLIGALKAVRASGDLFYKPVFNSDLAEKLTSLAPISSQCIRVVDVSWEGQDGVKRFSDAAAARAHEILLQKLRSGKSEAKRVSLGIGSGGTVRATMSALIRRLSFDEELVRSLNDKKYSLHFFPLAASNDTAHMMDDNPSWFLRDALEPTNLKFLIQNIHATPTRTEDSRQLEWVEKHIDFCISSIADLTDEHSMLRSHLQLRHNDLIDGLETTPKSNAANILPSSAVGEIQFMPYSEKTFVSLSAKVRKSLPVTLMTGSDLVDFCQISGKSVLLVVGKCLKHGCNVGKAQALLPLVRESNLRVFTDLVLDSETARKLMDLLGEKQPRRKPNHRKS